MKRIGAVQVPNHVLVACWAREGRCTMLMAPMYTEVAMEKIQRAGAAHWRVDTALALATCSKSEESFEGLLATGT